MNQQQIQCPKCGASISIDDVLTHQIEDRIRKNFSEAQKAREQELERMKAGIEARELEIAKSKKDMESVIAEKVSGQVEAEKLKLVKEARTQAEKEQTAKTALLEEQLKSKDAKLEQATRNEVQLRKEKIQLQEAKQAFELEKMRQLESERKTIQEQATQKAAEAQQYIIAQLRKQLTDATVAKDDLARKLEQGSQQTQGEVLELELEEVLQDAFLYDQIMPVPKGMGGADIIQKVMDRTGHECGQIVWESKKTKAWSNGWIDKLKEDQRAIKADIAVIVSIVLPDDVKGFAFRDGVWICDIKLAIPLATALRITLESVTHEKALSVGKSEKMEILYEYLTGVEFKQRIEAIVEAFCTMNEGLQKERRAFEKIWCEREKQLNKVMKNTIGMYGDLSGLVTLPAIKRLELGEGE